MGLVQILIERGLKVGGRGAKLKLSGIPKNKRKAIASYQKQINKHYDKIKTAKKTGRDTEYINHWEAEIRAFKGNIDKIIDRRNRK